MDDLQFRRTILSDPYDKSDEVEQAIANDPLKLKFSQDINALDEKIKQALDVTVPENLYNNLILRQTLTTHQQRKTKKRWHLALAACVATAFGLTLNFFMFSHSFKNLGDYALAHTHHEADNFSNDHVANVSLTSLNNKMSTFNGSFNHIIGKVISADYCRFDGTKSLHLVFQGKTSPVNIFIVPNNGDMTFSSDFSDGKLHGYSQQYNNANIIVVGDNKESLSKWQEKINENITWSI